MDRVGAWDGFPEGTYGGGGAYGSRYAVVPVEQMIIVLMIPLVPNATHVRETIPELIYRAIAP